jgi:hypothetical protein
VAHGKARTEAIAPGRARDGPQEHAGPQAGDALQLVLQHALLDGELRGGMQVLHRAAPTHAEMRTGGNDALAALALDRQRLRDVVARLAAHATGDDTLAGQRAANEHHLAVEARDAPRLEVERVDVEPAGRAATGRGWRAAHRSTRQRRRNSVQCGPSSVSR